ncbi:uncharacterized protein MELLADRAFT_67418 [Melampsora larici-populina 98AG31]|uniref:Uncharacterized protein n=1 Tax=Melampsora larici-populina (strain 98AG31 / pathotype 3-4-7) TaxID=747676 RepID=F4S328_MELLP|nr:uncharacterized protein MELLADRAFT_67418 [Melampsora larici-populina 98AG31]EGG00906.1 hypothetical protein MELLADRAFT_67418 [Melampsora larici-populina 98AG31]
MSLNPNRSFGNLSQDVSGSPGANPPRTPAHTSSIRSLNNFGSLRNQGSRSTAGSARDRDNRSVSPVRNFSSSIRAELEPSNKDGHNPSQDPVDQGGSRPLGANELLFFDEAVTNAGIDEVQRAHALTLAETRGSYRHIIMSVAHAQNMYQMSNMSESMLNISSKVKRALVKVEIVIDKVERILEKVESITDHVDTLTELVQSNQASGTDTTAHGPGNPHQPPTNSPSSDRHLFQAAVTTQAHKFINSATLESYTALEGPDRRWLAHSFYNSIKQQAVAHLIPQQINGVTPVSDARCYNTEVKNVCKHVREKLHLLLLSGVYDPKASVVHGAVPTVKSLVHKQKLKGRHHFFQIAIKFRQVPDHTDIETVWASTSEPTRSRITYLRREALRIFQIGRGSSSIWAAVDRQLHELRLRGVEYAASFYKIIYNNDCAAFDGVNTYDQIAENASLRLPFEDDIIAGIMPALIPNQTT